MKKKKLFSKHLRDKSMSKFYRTVISSKSNLVKFLSDLVVCSSDTHVLQLYSICNNITFSLPELEAVCTMLSTTQEVHAHELFLSAVRTSDTAQDNVILRNFSTFPSFSAWLVRRIQSSSLKCFLEMEQIDGFSMDGVDALTFYIGLCGDPDLAVYIGEKYPHVTLTLGHEIWANWFAKEEYDLAAMVISKFRVAGLIEAVTEAKKAGCLEQITFALIEWAKNHFHDKFGQFFEDCARKVKNCARKGEDYIRFALMLSEYSSQKVEKFTHLGKTIYFVPNANFGLYHDSEWRNTARWITSKNGKFSYYSTFSNSLEMKIDEICCRKAKPFPCAKSGCGRKLFSA